MLEQIVNIIRDWSLKYKLTKSFKYQNEININNQNNNKYLQIILDDTNIHNLNITSNTFIASFDLYILGFVKEKDNQTNLSIQSLCYDAAINILYKIDTDPLIKNIISIHDYSILTLSNYSTDNNSGVKLSFDLVLPVPIDPCIINDNFYDEVPIQEDKDNNIDIKLPLNDLTNIKINPIKLKLNEYK